MTSSLLPPVARRRAFWEPWLVGSICVFVAVVVPVMNLALPPSSPLYASEFFVSLVGKLTCYAMLALAMDLAWGYAGILSLCHGLFFALGGYAVGMYLMRSIGTEGMYRSALPDFMVFLDWKALPWYWQGFDNFAFAFLMALVVPGAVAYVFGFFAFRSRIGGVYFSIVTQALTYAAMLLFFRNATGFGGNNGLTDFKRLLGWSLRDPATKTALCAISGAGLALTYVLVRAVVGSRAGRVLTAMRDVEAKVRFCGYNPVAYKLFVWTLSAVLCGLAGALYVPQVGIINPSEMQPSNSVEIAIWVAVGGRGTLTGAILGALLVNGAKSWLTVAFPTAWLYLLGALFVLVTLYLPGGIVELAAVGTRARLAGMRGLRGVLARRSSASGSVPSSAFASSEEDTPVPPPTPNGIASLPAPAAAVVGLPEPPAAVSALPGPPAAVGPLTGAAGTSSTVAALPVSEEPRS